MPVDGYVPFGGGHGGDTQACNFTPEVPGVYEMQFTPTDDWIVGFPDTALVIVAPAAGANPPAPTPTAAPAK